MLVKQLMDLLVIIFWIVVILLPLFGCVAYVTFFERKVIAYMQGRVGPNRVGLMGILQPISDVLKLIHKEVIFPTASNRYLYFVAPVLALAPALAAWAVIPFNSGWTLADVDAGLLYVFSMTSLGVYGILIAGWASNSKYSFLGSMRAAAQVVSYEIAMGFTFVGVLLMSSSLRLSAIIQGQSGGIWHWYALPLLPLFIIYWICAVAETNRAPFDVSEGESELVAGFHVEYSGMGFALFFLAEYANMILVSAIASVLFLGGWLSPFQGIPFLGVHTVFIPGIVWLFIKMALFMYVYFWMRATFPRYRYDQIMHLGWKVLIPVSLIWIMVVAVATEYFR